MKIIKKIDFFLVATIFLAILFFIASSYYNFAVQKDNFVKWSSPDETANYTFAKLYGQTGEISIFESYNLLVDDIMLPRSFRSDFGVLKPVSFLGIILIYGKIASLFSYKVLPFLTPFFASLGIIYYYLLIKRLFYKQLAFFSSLLLSIFPVYFYYSTRSMFHNVLFIVLLLISVYYAVLAVSKKSFYWRIFLFALSGLFLGASIITRTSELIWILPFFFILWIFNIKKVGFLPIVVFLSFVLVGILPMFYYNQILYGQAFFGGYNQMNNSIISIGQNSTAIVKAVVVGEKHRLGEIFDSLYKSIFVFGFHPRQSLEMFQSYFVKMFSVLFWPGLFGFFIYLYQAIKKRARKRLAYIFSVAVFSAILILYYGSWIFNDNPDPSSRTIGNSYTRYWLPIYMAFIPMSALFFSQVLRFVIPRSFFKKNNKHKFLSFYLSRPSIILAIQLLVFSILFFYSTSFVLYGSEEGLVYSGQRLLLAKEEARQVLELTENNSTIITLYHDKVLFPERKVVVGLFNDKEMIKRYVLIAKKLPLYYYNFTLPEKDLRYLNNRRLAEFGLSIKKVEELNDSFTLYRLNLLQ